MTERLARQQGGVVSRRQLIAAGVERWQVRAEIRAGRWQPLGRQTIAVGQQSEATGWWRAVFEVGADAAIDGSSALRAAGLRNFEDVIHVSVSKGSRYRRPQGVRVHETRRRRPGDLLPDPLARVRPAIATVRAALWARSDRQAALLIVMAVQQRLVGAAELWDAIESLRRSPRRMLIRSVARDALGGAESLGELDFARMCRKAGLPAPDRQAMRALPSGRAFLDCRFDRYEVVVEIDGIHHLEPDNWVNDAKRQNEIVIGGDRVLRLPVLALRVDPSGFLGQLRRLLIDKGWRARQSPQRPATSDL